MFYSQVILAKKGPLAKVWMAANWGDKKLARPQIFATDISQSCTDIMNPSVPFALRLSGQLLLGVVRIYSRKVRYVLNDCTEAMLKLQMAFTKASAASSSSGGGGPSNLSGRELLTDQDAPTNNLVTNFGEYDQVHVVEGFCLPLPEENEWILAEDDDDADDAMIGGTQRTLLLTAHLPRPSQGGSPTIGGGGRPSASQPYGTPEEETWAPFDPENEDDEDEDEDEANGPGRSRVSDIEIVRAANDSLMSDDQTRRASSILDKSEDLPGNFARGTTPTNDVGRVRDGEDDFDMSHIPFDDDSTEDGGEQNDAPKAFDPTVDDSMLQLSHEGGGAAGDVANRTSASNNNNNLSGLDDSDVQTTPGSSKRTANDLELASSVQQQQPPSRRRKRRKVVIDNHRTELSNDQIKAMLQDTSDIVRRMVPPGSVWKVEDDDDDVDVMGWGPTMRQKHLQQQQQQQPPLGKLDLPELTRPFLADEEFLGGPRLHSRLKKLWTDNYYDALGQPCPFRQDKKSIDHQEEDVEQVRRNQGEREEEEEEEENDGEIIDRSELDVPMLDEEGGATNHPDQSQRPDDDDFEMPAVDDDEEEEEGPAEGGNVDFDEEEDQDENTHAYARGHLDDLDLGLVNELEVDEEEDDDQEDRQAVGDVSSSTTKWHKHTVRVLQHLQQNMRDPDRNRGGDDGDDNDNDEEYENLPDHLQFQTISKNVSTRRNAASVFFELLQLKTWDFIELDQSEAYGDITITPGVRFHEAPPNSK